MRVDEKMRRAALAVLLAGVVGVAGPAGAGLRFTPFPAPNGTDVYAFLQPPDGRALLATVRGVRLLTGESEALRLGDRTVLALAFAEGRTYAATGDAVFAQENANSPFVAVPLPAAGLSLPSVLVGDGATLYAGGLGVARRTGGVWTVLPSPGGFVTAMTLFQGDLVVGLQSRGAARLVNGAWVPLIAGFGLSEGANALVVFNGVLYAGTNQSVYSSDGTFWTPEPGFGPHDVRALATANSVLRAGTFDAGVFRRNGATWSPDNAGLVMLQVRCFGVLFGALYVGTAGGPPQRIFGGTWELIDDGTTGPGGAIVSDAAALVDASGLATGDFAVSSRGGGVELIEDGGNGVLTPRLSAKAGCGDVRAIVAVDASAAPWLAATNCGPLRGADASGWAPATAGLPTGANVTSLSPTSSGIFGGTSNFGIVRYGSGFWSLEPGVGNTTAVYALREAGGTIWAGTSLGLFARKGDGSWDVEENGLPAESTVGALGGGSTAHAGLLGAGVFRRIGATWRDVSAGLNTEAVTSFEAGGGLLAATAGSRGVVVFSEGGWRPETAGLPAGLDAKVVRYVPAAAAGSPAGSFGPHVIVGTAGHGAFAASTVPAARTLPVVLDVTGATGARFRSELTLGNTGAAPVTATLSFVAAPGFGAGTVAASTVNATIPARSEIRAADALAYLRGLGLAIPDATASSPIAGSLTLVNPAAGLYALARTYTKDAANGSYGLFYDAPSDVDAAEEEASVYGLRSVASDARSNLAVVHLPGRGGDPIGLSIQVFDATGAAAGDPLTVSLAPGEWKQFNEILRTAGLPDGAYGRARITRTAGTGSWAAYGVVNDAKTSDGSYLPMFRPGGVVATRRQIVPVVLDVFGSAGSRFTTELTLVNDGGFATPVDLVYRPAPGFGTAPGVPVVTLTLAAGEQKTIPDTIQFLRENGVNVPQPTASTPQAGTLTVTFRSLAFLDAPRTIALARTTTPNPKVSVGGRFGLFHPAIAEGGGSRTTAIVPSLTEDGSVRSNLAVIHAGGGSSLPVVVRVDLYDAATGQKTGNALTRTLNPGDWFQWSRILQAAGVPASVTKAYAVLTRTGGDDGFFAYGVVNDNVTSDGSYLSMIPAPEN